MERSSGQTDVTARAAHAVTAVAEGATVDVRTLKSGVDLAAAAELFSDLWRTPFSDHILRAFDLSGNYVAGAFDGAGRLVGASVAFAAVGAEPELHSHITGVATSQRRSGVGLVMKLHQRWWALEHGIGLVTWTFDPLIRRNANFNLARLGATADEYLENVYGEMNDALNGRDESDRLWVRWCLTDPEVEAAAAGTPRRVQAPPGAVARLKPGREGWPLVLAGPHDREQAFICQVPGDIESLRNTEPEVATAWRLALREVLGGSLRAGCRLLGLDDEGDYVVVPGEP